MFSNTAYEALFQYIGLELHSKFIQVLTSERVFAAMLLMIFAVGFFMTTAQFFSRYIPGALVKRRSVPLSKFVHITVCLIAGLSILRISGSSSVKSFTGQSWHENKYIISKARRTQPDYQVSFIFDVLSRTAEEGARLLNKIVDQMFKTAHSELEAPSFFYKAVMYAGSATIDNPELKSDMSYYTEECLPRILPFVGQRESKDRLDSLYRRDAAVDETLSSLQAGNTNCLDIKNGVREKLLEYAKSKSSRFEDKLDSSRGPIGAASWVNLQASMALVDHYHGSSESFAGIQKGAQPQSGAGRVFQYVSRFFSWDGLMSIIGNDMHGAVLAAQRSQEFSENLTRAPHVAGFIKMSLIAIFPWLVFPIVAGKWRILIWWFAAYGSVLLWAPIWTLLYHVVMGISLSTETLAAFGELSDGISLYSANLITSRMNYMYAVYSWLQLLIGGAFSGSVLWFARPILSDSETESAPEFIGDAAAKTSQAARLL
jgi:hypothetical protein